MQEKTTKEQSQIIEGQLVPPHRAIATMERPDLPLVTAEQAKRDAEAYQRLKATILEEDDYLWFVEWEEISEKGRAYIRRKAFSTRADAEQEKAQLVKKEKKRVRVLGRMKKSACRKMARHFGIEIPEIGQGQTSWSEVGGYIVSKEWGAYYTHTEWLDKGSLACVKASTTVFVLAKSGRAWMGRGGAHQGEKFADDFAVGATSFTRAVNRGVLDIVGWGEDAGEEVQSRETLPGQAEADEDDKPPPQGAGAPPTTRQAPPTDAQPSPPQGKGSKYLEAWATILALLKGKPEKYITASVAFLKKECDVDVPVDAFAKSSPPPGVAYTALVKLAEQIKAGS